MTPLLEIRNLTTMFGSGDDAVTAVRSLSLSVGAGETLAVVGESGCGKSITAYSVLRLVPPPGRIVEGTILFRGQDLLSLPESEMRRIRGDRISMIFQEPMTSLNPVFRVGDQIAEAISTHRDVSRREAREQGIELLRKVRIPSPEKRYDDYPHQLSGGMRQRVMIAMALSCSPDLLIADEPTTALDVTIQAQILDIIDRLKEETGMGLLLITHDMAVVAEHSMYTAVMYAGQLVEYGRTDEIFRNPQHPYTTMLLSSLPQLYEPGTRLSVVPGSILSRGWEGACALADRCPSRSPLCSAQPPAMREVAPGHLVRCGSDR